MELKEFAERISKLRYVKGVSARSMSLDLGQSENYIINIENGLSYPSMTAFFDICDYLGITPKEFFDMDSVNPLKENELVNACKGLTNDQIEPLIKLANELKGKRS